MFSSLIIFMLVLRLTATIAVERTCPYVVPINNFNFTEFAKGLWYEIARYPNSWEDRANCTTIEYINDSNGIKFKVSEVVEEHRVYMEGYIDKAPFSGNTGVVVYKGDNFKDTDESNNYIAKVLSIDYNKYYIDFECRYDETKNLTHEYVWIASRTPTLDAETKQIVDSFLNTTNIIDKKKLVWDVFTEETCFANS